MPTPVRGLPRAYQLLNAGGEHGQAGALRLQALPERLHVPCPASTPSQRGRGPPIRPSAPGPPRSVHTTVPDCPSASGSTGRVRQPHSPGLLVNRPWHIHQQRSSGDLTCSLLRKENPGATNRPRCWPLCKPYYLEGSAQVNGYLLTDPNWPAMGLRGHRTGLAGHACPAPQHGTKADGAMKGI